MTVRDFYEYLNEIAPFESQCGWDNSGLLVGSFDSEVKSVILCLDVTNDVIEQAVANDCNLIISHHPVIFSALKAVEFGTPLFNAIKNNINIISAHTNLDISAGGVNDVICEKLGINNVTPLTVDDGLVMRMGETDFENTEEFAAFVLKQLEEACHFFPVNHNKASVSFYDAGRKVKKVAVCGGSAGDLVADAFLAGCDTFVTGEAKHHEYLEAQRLGMNMVVAGHFTTERPVILALCEKILKAFPGVAFCVAHEECPYKTVI